MVLTQCDYGAVLWMSKVFLCLPVYIVILCCLVLCRVVSCPCPCVCLSCASLWLFVCLFVCPSLSAVAGMSAFRSLWPSTMVSCFLLLVSVSSTFRDVKSYLICGIGRTWSLEKCLKQLREVKNMKPLWKVKDFEKSVPWQESVPDFVFFSGKNSKKSDIDIHHTCTIQHNTT